MSGQADVAPYTADGQTLSLATIRFGPGPGGATALSTVAQLDGAFPGGKVQALRLPIEGQVGKAGSFAFGTSCAVVSFNYLQMSSLQLGSTRLPVCPVGRAIVSKSAAGPVLTSARMPSPVLNGRLGSSAFHLQAASGLLTGQQFSFNRLGMRLGQASSPILFDAEKLTGIFGRDLSGGFTGAGASIGKVPLLLSDGVGKWIYRKNDLIVDSSATVSDRDPNPRFYPLKSNNIHFTIAGDYVRATGALHHLATDTLVTNVSIEHRLSSGAGHALLDVPGIAFGPNLQPDQLSRLTEGVVALVNGTVKGQGRIDWASGGKVTSTGDFSTAGMDLAAPFGPVTGLTTSVHFTDLLEMESAPHQVATVATINPGITVTDGVIRYQLLRNNLVRVERGEWPFMGGRLILDETVLNFGSPSAKRLTFELQGFDAKMFIDSLGFQGLEITGTFDGVLPMIFDQNGGRIEGGQIIARKGGGTLAYVGELSNAEIGTMGKLAFDALKAIRYSSLDISLDGRLDGEMVSRVRFTGVREATPEQSLITRLIRNLPFRFNIQIRAPFRGLVGSARAYMDPRLLLNQARPAPAPASATPGEPSVQTKESGTVR